LGEVTVPLAKRLIEWLATAVIAVSAAAVIV